MYTRQIASLAALACLFPVVGIGHATAQSPSIYQATLAEPNTKTLEVSTEEVRRLVLDGSAMLLDTRGRAEFEAGHIPGAINIDAPARDQVAVVSRIVGGAKEKAVVLYCNGPFCQASRRLADLLVENGFTNVRRYQLGIPVWRALGGPTVVELAGIKRVFKADQTAVFFDARAADEFAKGSVAGARSAPVDDVVSGKLKKIDLPEDDFNRRIVLFGRDTSQARKLADFMSKRPWHNVMYFAGTYTELYAGLKQ